MEELKAMKKYKYGYEFPRLTKEEWNFFLKKDAEFFKKYNINWPLFRRIASSLQTLAVAKLLGVGYQGIYEKNKEEAIKHHLKACTYNPTVAFRSSIFRKHFGLPVFENGHVIKTN